MCVCVLLCRVLCAMCVCVLFVFVAQSFFVVIRVTPSEEPRSHNRATMVRCRRALRVVGAAKGEEEVEEDEV